MAIESIGSIANYAAGSADSVNKSDVPATSGKSGSDIDINDFFKLMIAQLQNQSLNDTVDNAQFITQMAQFSTLTQMNELTKSMQSSMAIALIGKSVDITTTGADGNVLHITGSVEKVSFFNNQPYIYLDGKYYELSQVTDITK
jgi:flagellar basal-body rod modification protein FlgD